jgi:hypothetical protein
MKCFGTWDPAKALRKRSFLERCFSPDTWAEATPRYVAPDGLRSADSPLPTVFAVGRTTSALAGLARQEYVSVFTNAST